VLVWIDQENNPFRSKHLQLALQALENNTSLLLIAVNEDVTDFDVVTLLSMLNNNKKENCFKSVWN